MVSPIIMDPSPEHVVYALLGCFIIFFGLVSLFVKEKLFISEAYHWYRFVLVLAFILFFACPSSFVLMSNRFRLTRKSLLPENGGVYHTDLHKKGRLFFGRFPPFHREFL